MDTPSSLLLCSLRSPLGRADHLTCQPRRVARVLKPICSRLCFGAPVKSVAIITVEPIGTIGTKYRYYSTI